MKRLVKTFESFQSEDFVGHSNMGTEPDHLEIDHADHHEVENYMFFGNLETIHRLTGIILEMDPMRVDELLKNGHNWATEHVATSKDDIEEVANFLINEMSEEPMHKMAMEEGYSCNECGATYEAHECYEGMSCDCGGEIAMD